MADDASSAPTEAGQPGAGGRSAPLSPGKVVADTYQITRLIGQGGMGAVWEANHLRLPGKKVVIKVLLNGATDQVALARFRREAEIGSRLGHPHIVQVLDFNTLPEGPPYIVLELLLGETLATRMRRARLSLDEAMTIVSQVGSALQAAHREGIVHRDLKPENIFLCRTDFNGQMRDVAKILDFGISKIRDANTVLTQDSALVGTPQYMAPEQATGANAEIDARTDIFALGAITYEMLAGRPPFWGDSLAAVVHAVVYAPTPPLQQYAPEIPGPIASAVERAMSKSREARFQDVSSFVTTLVNQSRVPPSGIEPRPPVAPVAGGTAALPYSGTISLDVSTGEEAKGPRSGVRTTPERPHATAARAGLPRGLLALIAILVASGGAAAVLWPRHPPVTDTGPAKVVEPRKIVETVKVDEPTPHPDPLPAGRGEGRESTPHPGSLPGPLAAGRGEGKRAEKALSPAAAADLTEAEAALAAGKSADAIRLAQHSLYAQQSSQAYSVMARARCAQGDLGNAKAALAKVAARERAAVVRACSKTGIELR